MRNFIKVSGILALVCLFGATAFGGFEDRMSGIELKTDNYAEFPEISAPSGNPSSGYGWLYVKDNGSNSDLYFEDDGGTVTELTATAATAYDDIGDPDADSSITFGDNEILEWTFADTNEDMFTLQGLGAFGNVSVFRVEQKTGDPTDGTVLEVVAADANVDPLVVSASGKANAFVVGQNTGVVTIAGVAEGTDALVLTAGDITLTDGDLNLDGGDATFAEDVTVTGTLDAGTLQISSIAPSSGNLTVNAQGSGTISIGNSSTGAINLTGGGVNIGDGATDTLTITGIIDSDVTLDDGTTDSPKLIFKDSDDEQSEIYQDQSSDDLNVECHDAGDSLAVTVGNLSVGTPNANTITVNGGDLYVTDDAEIDGTLAVDTDLDVNGTANFSSTVTGQGTITAATIQATTLLDVNEAVDIDLNANDEEVSIVTTATDYAAGSGVLEIYDDSAGQTNASYLLRLMREANGDAQDNFILCEDNSDGSDNNGDDMFAVNTGGDVTAAGTITGTTGLTGGTVQVTTLLDVDEDVDVDFDADDEEVNITNSAEYDNDAAQVTIYNSDADLTDGDLTANMYLLRLRYADDGDADGAFMVCEDNDGDDMFTIDAEGATTVAGTLTASGAATVTGALTANGTIVGDGATTMVGVMPLGEVVTSANVITAAECGSVFFLDADSEFQSTLPAMSTVTAGCTLEFYIEDAPSGASYTILTGNTDEDLLVGGVVERETDTGNDGPYDASADTITFVDGTSVEGDYVKIVASGNYWYVTGVSNADGGITITDSD